MLILSGISNIIMLQKQIWWTELVAKPINAGSFRDIGRLSVIDSRKRY